MGKNVIGVIKYPIISYTDIRLIKDIKLVDGKWVLEYTKSIDEAKCYDDEAHILCQWLQDNHGIDVVLEETYRFNVMRKN